MSFPTVEDDPHVSYQSSAENPADYPSWHPVGEGDILRSLEQCMAEQLCELGNLCRHIGCFENPKPISSEYELSSATKPVD